VGSILLHGTVAPCGERALPLGVGRQNVVATLNYVISPPLIRPLLFYQKERRKGHEVFNSQNIRIQSNWGFFLENIRRRLVRVLKLYRGVYSQKRIY
jgi:hypothetical protein